MRKAHATLEKPGAEDSDVDFDGFTDELQTEIPLSKDHVEELQRYGIWSEEAISLNLPSYVSAFALLSVMPLEVFHFLFPLYKNLLLIEDDLIGDARILTNAIGNQAGNTESVEPRATDERIAGRFNFGNDTPGTLQ